MKKILAILLGLISPAFGQSVQQSGDITPGHVTTWITDGVVGDGGPLGGSASWNGMFNAFDFLCSNSLSNTPLIISCGLSATGTNTWNGIQNFSGGATAPTRSPLDSTTNAATTAFVANAVATLQDNVLSRYGAKCDGTTNDDAAISQWLTATVAVGKPAYFTGTCAFATPIVLPDVDNVTIVGASPGTSVLLYVGATTNTDIIKIGTAGVACCAGQHRALNFANWQVKSNTFMTGGAAVHFAQIVRSSLFNWWVCTQDCANNFYHGVWFDQVDTIRWCGVNAQAQQDVVRINGQIGGPQSDLWIDCGGKISGGIVGVRVAGGFGGYFCGSIDIIANGINTLIDTTLTSAANAQFLFGPLCVLDSSGVNDLRVSDTLSTVGSPAIIVANGTWFASAGSHCILVDSGVTYPITLIGGTVTNCAGDGIRDNSALARLIVQGTRISNNTGIGLNLTLNTTGSQATVFSSADFVNNTGGAVNGATNGVFAQGCAAGTPSSSFTATLGYVTHC